MAGGPTGMLRLSTQEGPAPGLGTRQFGGTEEPVCVMCWGGRTGASDSRQSSRSWRLASEGQVGSVAAPEASPRLQTLSCSASSRGRPSAHLSSRIGTQSHGFRATPVSAREPL